MPKGRDKETDNKWALDLLKKSRYSPEWWKKSSGKAEVTDSPIDMILMGGPIKTLSKVAGAASREIEKRSAMELEQILSRTAGKRVSGAWDEMTPIAGSLLKMVEHGSMPAYGIGQAAKFALPEDKQQYCHGGKMYFLGSDLSFGDAVKQNPGAFSGAAGMVAGGIEAVDKPGGSMAGAIGKGAASGASAGMMLGPWGAAAGAVIGGGLGALQKKKADDAELIAYNQQSLSNYAAGTQGIDPSMHNYRLGGPLLTTFSGGGTHEQNPNGGIQQGVNGSNGEPNLVEADETKSNAPGSKDYIFPARTIFTNPKEYNLGGNLAGLSFADASKKIAKYSDERPNDPIASKDYELKTVRLKQANEDEIAMREFQNQNPQDKVTHVNSQDKLGSKMFKCGGFIFKDY